MKNFLQAILILLFSQCTSTQAPQFNETIIFENSVVQVRLLCRDTGSIDQSDWLKLSIKNKTSDSLLINEINFEINEGSIPPNRISLSEYRAGDKYVMLPKFYNLRVRWGDYEVVTISPHDNLTSSKYITNYASVYLRRVSSVQKICPYFNLKRVLINLLSMNAPSWGTVPDNKAKAYNWLAKTLKFDPNGKFNQDNFQNWSQMISSMSVSGDKRIIDYLVPLLDNEQEYDVEDWSKYDNHGAVKNPKPDILKIRVCDVAFVGLLRAIGKIQYQFDFLTSRFDLYIDRDFMEDPNPIRKISYPEGINFDLTKALKMIRLTPASKLKIKEYIENDRF